MSLSRRRNKLDVTNFKGAFASLARPTLFRCSGFGMPEQLDFMAKAAQLPATTLGMIEVPYMGRKIKVAGDRTYEDFTITIFNNKDWVLRDEFENWVKQINDPVLNTGVGAHADYKRDGKIDQLDMNGDVLASYNIVGAFPTSIAAIELAFDTNDTVEEFVVTLTFDYFTRA